MVRESNQNVFLIQIDASIFAEFEIPEFEISRDDCIRTYIYGFLICDVRISNLESKNKSLAF